MPGCCRTTGSNKSSVTTMLRSGLQRTFKDAGIKFVRSEYSKSELYLEALPLFTRGLIAIPDLPPLLKELRLLERQTHRSGKDTVDHGKRGSR